MGFPKGRARLPHVCARGFHFPMPKGQPKAQRKGQGKGNAGPAPATN